MKSGIVFDIQNLSFHDGPGLRTTVFLKGCPLSASSAYVISREMRKLRRMRESLSYMCCRRKRNMYELRKMCGGLSAWSQENSGP